MKDEWRMTKDDDFKLLKGFALWQTNRQTDEQTDICNCRVAFATENSAYYVSYYQNVLKCVLGNIHIWYKISVRLGVYEQ